MNASFRKIRLTREGEEPGYYAIANHAGRLLWACSHNHPTRKKALACARRHIAERPKTRRGELSKLRRTWTPYEPVIPTHPDDGRPMLSRTFIEHFLQCTQYQADSSPEAAFGIAVHAAIHAYYQLCVSAHQESMLSDVDRIVRDSYFRQAGTEPNRYEEAKNLVYEFVAQQPAELDKLLVVDRRPALEFEMMAFCGWFWLTGRADRIDRVDGDDPDDPPRGIRINDIKTGWDPEARRRRIVDAPLSLYPAPIPHNFQRRTYAIAAFLDPRLGPRLEYVETAFMFPRNRREAEIITYERGELDEWWGDISWALLQRWQSRTAAPTGCASCEYCALRLTCGAATVEARAKPSSVDEARTVAQEIIRERARTRGKAKVLRDFMRGRDMLVTGGLEVGYAPPREQRWYATDKLAVVRYLNANGYNGAAVLKDYIDDDLVPDDKKAAMVEAGIAKWDPGRVDWRMRKAGTDEEAGGPE